MVVDFYLKVTEVAESSVAVSAFVEVFLSLAIFVEDDIFWIDIHLLDLFEFFEVLNLWMRGRAGSVWFSIRTGMAEAFVGFFRVRASLHLKSKIVKWKSRTWKSFFARRRFGVGGARIGTRPRLAQRRPWPGTKGNSWNRRFKGVGADFFLSTYRSDASYWHRMNSLCPPLHIFLCVLECWADVFRLIKVFLRWFISYFSRFWKSLFYKFSVFLTLEV